jgi:hypothetical protein
VEGGDNTINAAEAAGGIVITGTAEAGSTVTVNGVAATVAAKAPIPRRSRPCGGWPLTVTVNSTDAAGNTATDTRTLTVDRGTALRSRVWKAATTRSTRLRLRDGIVITGTAEAGSTVTVNGVAGDGCCERHLHATIPTATCRLGRPLRCQRRDHGCGRQHRDRDPDPDPWTAGTTVAITGVEGGDNTINAAEAAGGIVITGTAEAGSTVTVNGVSRPLRPTALHGDHPGSGRGRPAYWSPVNSTDAAGNTATASRP